MSHGGGGSKKCGKSVTCYSNGPLQLYLLSTWYEVYFLLLIIVASESFSFLKDGINQDQGHY